MIVVNRDRRDAGLAEKLARKAPCSVLGVPDQAPVKLDHILAAFDFSEFSRSALEVAVAFSKPTEAKLSIIHSFEVPWGLHKTGVSREQLVTETKSFLGQELKRETASAVSGLNGHSHEVVESSLPEAALARAADEWKCDLVVIGCRGHGAIYATLLGSTAEAILRESPVPVLAVKPKGSGVPLLEQLRQAEH